MKTNSNLKKKLAIISSLAVVISTAQAICVPRSSESLLTPAPSPNSNPSLESKISPSPITPFPNSSPSPSSQTPPNEESKISSGGSTETSQSPSSSTSTTDNPALKQICNSTDCPDLCLSSISPFFDGKTDLISVLQMAINATTQQAKLAISVANNLARAGGISPNSATALEDCSDNYSDAVDGLQTAMDATKSRDIGTVNSMLSAVVTDSWTCDEEFPGQNPMAVYEVKLGNLASNSLAIASLIK